SQQHAHRARGRVARGHREDAAIDRAGARRVVEAFVDAAASGRTERLVALLTDDATAIGDGAGLSDRLVRHVSPERVAAALRGAVRPPPAKRRLAGGPLSFYASLVNGTPALITARGDRVVGVVVLETRGGRVAVVRGIAFPARLGRLNERWHRGGHG